MGVHLLFILACVFGAAAYFLHTSEKNRFYKEKEEELEDIENYKDNSYNQLFEENKWDGWKSGWIHHEREKEKALKFMSPFFTKNTIVIATALIKCKKKAYLLKLDNDILVIKDIILKMNKFN